MKKKLFIAAGSAAAVIAVAALILTVLYLMQRVDHDITLHGQVQSETVIRRDDSGIPLIMAHSKDDICFALGYLHAQDRLVVMEYYRAIANSEAARIIPGDGAILDRIIRASGIRRASKEIMEALTPQYRDNLKAYVNGINTIRNQWYKLYHKAIMKRNWEPVDAVAILLLREWTNAYLNNRELIFSMPSAMQSPVLNEIIPQNLQYFHADEQSSTVQLLKKIRKLLNDYVGAFNRGYAFFLPPDGKENLRGQSAFSYNSSFAVYPDWYPVHVQYGDILIRGVTCAGLPFILSGHNQGIGFLSMNLDVDTEDFIVEEVKTIEGTARHWSRTGWKEFTAVQEPVFTADKAARQEIVWHTDDGPVLNEVTGDKNYGDSIVALKCLMPKEDYVRSLFDLPFCENIEKARDTIRNTTSYPRMCLLTSDEKALAVSTGKLPYRNSAPETLRRGPYFDWNGVQDITSYQENRQGPLITGSGFTGSMPAQAVSWSIPDDARQNRIKWLAAASNSGRSALACKKILTDTYSIAAEKFIPLFLQNLKVNPVTSAQLAKIYFSDWNYRAESSLVAPTLFYGILLGYLHETFYDEFDFMIDDMMANSNLLMDSFQNMAALKKSVYFNDTKTDTTESSDEIFDRAFLKTMRKLNRRQGPIMEEWKWGGIHRNHYSVPFEKTFIARLVTGDIPNHPIQGGSMAIYNNSVSSELAPVSNTSLLGILDGASAEISMDFSCSVNPMSSFFNLKTATQRFTPFTRIESKHTTVIKKNP
jgi:penicillin amidase